MRAQASAEYIMIVGFITFAIIGVLALAYIYITSATDSISQNDLGNMINKIISTSEYVYYSGAPALATIVVYAPAGIENIAQEEFTSDGRTYHNLRVDYYTSSGTNTRIFSSNVKIILPPDIDRLKSKGAKQLKISAVSDGAEISFAS